MWHCDYWCFCNWHRSMFGLETWWALYAIVLCIMTLHFASSQEWTRYEKNTIANVVRIIGQDRTRMLYPKDKQTCGHLGTLADLRGACIYNGIPFSSFYLLVKRWDFLTWHCMPYYAITCHEHPWTYFSGLPLDESLSKDLPGVGTAGFPPEPLGLKRGVHLQTLADICRYEVSWFAHWSFCFEPLVVHLLAPLRTYLQNLGIRHFDVVVLITDQSP